MTATAAVPGPAVHFLREPPRFLFFTGKGGVGKTSLACASAIRLAGAGRRILLVSTDPASNVAQVLECPVGPQVTPVPGVPGLDALEIDPLAAAAAYRERLVGPVRGTLPDSAVRAIEEQLSGACTTEIAAFDEFTALLTDTALESRYDHVIFDTAPTGHTLRLLQLPGAWTGFLETGRGDASCLGPLAGLDKQRSRYAAAVAALADPSRTRLILVSRPQPSSLAEVARTSEELASIGLRNQHLVVNGHLAGSDVGGDELAAAIHRRETAAVDALPGILRGLARDEVPLRPFNLMGIERLGMLLGGGITASSGPGAEAPVVPAGLGPLIDDIAAQGTGLVMLMGKGGVGKTTVAAAIAVGLAARGLPVHLTTTDPAAHLAETLGGLPQGLTLSRIDPKAETERYRRQVLASKGAGLDEAGRALLEEDLRSPCTEEIAVFQAFSRALREAGRKIVVMDTAPTGHTLLLLDTTGAYDRDVRRHMQGDGRRVVTPMMQLQDPARTRVIIVTLAEPTPVLEAAQLQADLRRAGIEPWAWVINQSLAVTDTASPVLRQRAAAEAAEISTIASQHAVRIAVLPLAAEEPIGAERLLALTHPA
ncbi:MAG TPA: arsenical pump-driving ATPase [Gemmatimonadales bacterium]